MCGILGTLNTSSEDAIRCLDTIKHRGPDFTSYYQHQNLFLGHQRLSIQDTSENGNQPMFSECGDFVIVFNGEIYNHWEIRKSLKGEYRFKSSSDTETLLYGYIEHGIGILNKLNGIFAFAILQISTGEVIIARDQFGVKPLYYYQNGSNILFSSEIKAICASPTFQSELDCKSLLSYIQFLWSPGSRTPFQKVKKLLPGHYIKFNIEEQKQLNPQSYYEIPFDGIYWQKTEAEWIDALDEQLFNAVKRQLLADVPIGFFLSGGLDSSAVVAMAKRAMPDQRLVCYTVDSGNVGMESEGFSDDLYYAQKVADHLGVELCKVKGDIDILQDFDKMIYHLDEPQADLAPLHVYNICKQARKDGCVVLLGGTAGDDVFSGYRRHQALRYERYFRIVPKWVGGALKYIVRKLDGANPKVRRVKKVLAQIGSTPLDRCVGYFMWISHKTSLGLFSKKCQDNIGSYQPLHILKNTFSTVKDKSLLNKVLMLELKYFLTDHNLNYTDKLSMAVGVEVRVPFLDKELVEFSTKIPPELKMNGVNTKYLLKKVMERYLPHDVIYRSKAGFGVPLRNWIDNDLRPRINTRLSEQSVNELGVFNHAAIQHIISENTAHRIDGSYTILSLLSIDSWLRQFKKWRTVEQNAVLKNVEI